MGARWVAPSRQKKMIEAEAVVVVVVVGEVVALAAMASEEIVALAAMAEM